MAERAARVIRRIDTAWCGPELRARQTALALGLHATEQAALRDLDCGIWVGRTLDEVAAADPAGFAAWLADPHAAPHEGEPVVALLERVRGWLADLAAHRGRIVAVTHASVVRAAIVVALEAAPVSFWRIDVAPMCRVQLRIAVGRSTLMAMERATSADITG